jgi:Tfp pilus assembly protein PilF
MLVRAGKITEASDYFLRALALRNDRADAQNAMGEILANQQKTAEAIDWFKRAARANPDYVETYLNLGFLQQSQGEMTQPWPVIRRPRVWSRKARRIISTGPMSPPPGISGTK